LDCSTDLPCAFTRLGLRPRARTLRGLKSPPTLPTMGLTSGRAASKCRVDITQGAKFQSASPAAAHAAGPTARAPDPLGDNAVDPVGCNEGRRRPQGGFRVECKQSALMPSDRFTIRSRSPFSSISITRSPPAGAELAPLYKTLPA